MLYYLQFKLQHEEITFVSFLKWLKYVVKCFDMSKKTFSI